MKRLLQNGYLILLLFTLCLSRMRAQTVDLAVVGTCSNRISGTTLVVDWTVGEVLISTVAYPSSIVSQGFHQPEVDSVATAIDQVARNFNIDIFPNPTSNELNVMVRTDDHEPLRATIYSSTGLFIVTHEIDGNGVTVLNTSALADGIYFIRFSKVGRDSEIIKNFLKCE